MMYLQTAESRRRRSISWMQFLSPFSSKLFIAFHSVAKKLEDCKTSRIKLVQFFVIDLSADSVFSSFRSSIFLPVYRPLYNGLWFASDCSDCLKISHLVCEVMNFVCVFYQKPSFIIFFILPNCGTPTSTAIH